MNISTACLSKINIFHRAPYHRTIWWSFVETLLLLTIITYLIKYIVSRTRKSRKQNFAVPQVKWFPIPMPKFFVAWWVTRKTGKDGLHLFEELNRRYGNIYEIPFGLVNATVINDPVVVQKLLASHNFGHMSKSNFMSKLFLMREYHNSLFASNRQTWQLQRKTLSKGFSYKALLSYYSVINKHAKNIVKDLLNKAAHNARNGLMNSVRNHVTKMTGELLTGKIWSEQDVCNIIERSERHAEDLQYRFRNTVWFNKYLWRFHPRKINYEKTTINLRHIFKNAVQEYKSANRKTCETKGDKLYFTPLIQYMHEKDFCTKDMVDSFGSIMFPELDATCTAIEFLLMHLAKNPEHQEKCRKEIDSAFAEGMLSNFDLNHHDIAELKYVERCILESLRLTPSIPAFARKLSEPFKVNSKITLQPGTIIIILPWVNHRNSREYPNPERFDPDRFLDNNMKKKTSGTFIPFSFGPRNCLGWKLALIQMKIIAAWILHNFEITTECELTDTDMKFGLKLVSDEKIQFEVKARFNS